MNLDSARQSQIEALSSERGGPSPRGKGDEEDRFGELAASPNSPNLTERRIALKPPFLQAARSKKPSLVYSRFNWVSL